MIYYRTLWLSDIHLGNRDCHALSLLSFLKKIECDRLYLVGDIVDLIALKKKVCWPQSHGNILKQVHHMANNGTEVIYIPGNHDRPLRDFDHSQLFNVNLHKQYIHETRQGKRLLIVHGDEFDHAVLYRSMNKLIGEHAYSFMTFLNRSLHKTRSFFGLPYWSLASYLKNNISQARQTIHSFAKAAVAEAKQRNLDGIVCGHIHKAELREIDGILYCNDGDWTESCTALVEDINGELALLQWEDIQQLIHRPDYPVKKLSEAA